MYIREEEGKMKDLRIDYVKGFMIWKGDDWSMEEEDNSNVQNKMGHLQNNGG